MQKPKVYFEFGMSLIPNQNFYAVIVFQCIQIYSWPATSKEPYGIVEETRVVISKFCAFLVIVLVCGSSFVCLDLYGVLL